MRRGIKKYVNWPFESTYCLVTNMNINAGTVITTDYNRKRTPYQKGYQSYMDYLRAKNNSTAHKYVVPNCDYADRTAKSMRSKQANKESRQKSIDNLRRGGR